MIKTCKCEHSKQDSLHGANKRVFNPTKKSKGDKTVYRCSVCNNED
jgi:hypothetical protein